MTNSTTNNILEALNWRYATKSFDTTKTLSNEQLNMVKESMRLAPSSYGLQAWKFVEVKTPVIRQQLKAIAWNQAQMTDSSSLFAFCSYVDPKSISDQLVGDYIFDIASQRNVPVESLAGLKGMLNGAVASGGASGDPAQTGAWLDNQLYIALGQAMTACALAGIDTCAMEGFDPQKANEILGLDELGLQVKCFLCVGFRSPDDKYIPTTTKKVRFSQDQVFLQR